MRHRKEKLSPYRSSLIIACACVVLLLSLIVMYKALNIAYSRFEQRHNQKSLHLDNEFERLENLDLVSKFSPKFDQTKHENLRKIRTNLITPNSKPKALYTQEKLDQYCSEPTKSQQCIDYIVELQSIEPKITSNQEKLCQHLTDFSNLRRGNHVFLFHTFWAGDIEHGAFILFITSFLATQNDCTKLIIWTSENSKFTTKDALKLILQRAHILTSNPNVKHKTLRHIAKRLEVKPFVLKQFTYLSQISIDITSEAGFSAIATSDVIRFFALKKFGGIYLDGDSMFLRDFYPLWETEFLYPWGATGTVNTAVLGLKKESIISNLFVKLISENAYDLKSAAHPRAITEYVERYKLLKPTSKQAGYKLELLPIVLFDAYWLYNDGATEQKDHWLPKGGFQFFTDTKYKTMTDENRHMDQLFPASFSYHIHNTAQLERIPIDSIGGAFLFKFQNELRKKLLPQ